MTDSGDLGGLPWDCYQIVFNRSVQDAGFPKRVAFRLQGAMHEMAENAMIHAEAPIPALVGFEVREGMARFSVVDVGIGVLASLRSNPAYEHVRLHKEAIRLALQDGTSSIGPGRRGMGFRQVFKALSEQWGHLRFRSGRGCIQMDGTGLDADRGEVSFPPPLPGFQVSVCCRATAPTG